METRFNLLIEEVETGDTHEAFEFEVASLADADRLTHPLMAQEFAEQIQCAVKENFSHVLEYEEK